MVPYKLVCIVNRNPENPHFRQLLGNGVHVEFYRIHETAYVWFMVKSLYDFHVKRALLWTSVPSAVPTGTLGYGLSNQGIMVALPVEANDLPES